MPTRLAPPRAAQDFDGDQVGRCAADIAFRPREFSLPSCTRPSPNSATHSVLTMHALDRRKLSPKDSLSHTSWLPSCLVPTTHGSQVEFKIFPKMCCVTHRLLLRHLAKLQQI
eukprot:scaffold1738_cov171-Pinguiococcus_pyrenoidosus.AAC.4